MEDAFKFISGLIQRIVGLDPAMLVFVFCIAVGYVLKSIEGFPNRHIPKVVMGVPPILYPLMVWNGFDVRKIASDIALAIIFAALAWGSHNWMLRKLVDAKLFPPDSPEGDETKPTNTNDQNH